MIDIDWDDWDEEEIDPSGYPLLCLLLRDTNYKFIEWIGNNKILRLRPKNIDIFEYMKQNNNQQHIRKSLEKPKFSSGGSDSSLKMINKFKNYIF